MLSAPAGMLVHPTNISKRKNMTKNLEAALAAAKTERRQCVADADQQASFSESEHAVLPALEAKLVELAAARADAIAMLDREQVLEIDRQAALVRIDIEIAHERIKTFGADHTKALTALAKVQAAVRRAAEAMAWAEIDVLARKFTIARDHADKLGWYLDNSIGPRTNLPAHIELALSRLPKRDDLHTPVNILRAGGYRSQRAWDERIRELTLDDADETQAESRVA